jgi:hypothetical protein
MRDTLELVADFEGLTQSDLVREGIMPFIRRHMAKLPINYTMLTLRDGKYCPPPTGGTWKNPASALMHFSGDCFALVRGTIYPNGEFFLEKRPGKRKLWTWWRECLLRVMKNIEGEYPQYERIFSRIDQEAFDRKMIFGWSNYSFLTRLLALPETNAREMDARMIAYMQCCILWFRSSPQDPTFLDDLRAGVRGMMAADSTLHEWCGDVMLKLLGIKSPGEC